MKRDLPLTHVPVPTTVTVGTRAIDVGYANTKFTLGRKMINGQAALATDTFPSVAATPSKSKRIEYVPNHLGSDGCLTEIGGAQYFAGRGVGMHLSGTQTRHVLADYCTTPDYMALMHGAMHYMLEEAGNPSELVIEHLALGLPLNTYGEYRHRLVELVEGTHRIGSVNPAVGTRTVRVLNAYVLMQPFGALANMAMLNRDMALNGWNLVIDVGGGTIDYLVALDKEPNTQRSGAHPESMLQCAYAVAKDINENLVNNFQVVLKIDQAIRSCAETVVVAGTPYEMSNFKGTIDSVLRRAYDAMLARVSGMEDFDNILICGGGGPVFYDFLRENAKHLLSRIKMDAGAIYSNVRGFHAACEAFTGASSHPA